MDGAKLMKWVRLMAIGGGISAFGYGLMKYQMRSSDPYGPLPQDMRTQKMQKQYIKEQYEKQQAALKNESNDR